MSGLELCLGPHVYRLSPEELRLLQRLETRHRVFNGSDALWMDGDLCRRRRDGRWEPVVIEDGTVDHLRLQELTEDHPPTVTKVRILFDAFDYREAILSAAESSAEVDEVDSDDLGEVVRGRGEMIAAMLSAYIDDEPGRRRIAVEFDLKSGTARVLPRDDREDDKNFPNPEERP